MANCIPYLTTVLTNANSPNNQSSTMFAFEGTVGGTTANGTVVIDLKDQPSGNAQINQVIGKSFSADNLLNPINFSGTLSQDKKTYTLMCTGLLGVPVADGTPVSGFIFGE